MKAHKTEVAISAAEHSLLVNESNFSRFTLKLNALFRVHNRKLCNLSIR